MRAISAILFLVGAAAITIAVAGVWVWLMIAAIQSWGPLAGWCLLGLTFFGLLRYPHIIRAPWATWLDLWSYMDREIDRRLTSGHHR